jgi:hypothetical protein
MIVYFSIGCFYSIVEILDTWNKDDYPLTNKIGLAFFRFIYCTAFWPMEIFNIIAFRYVGLKRKDIEEFGDYLDSLEVQPRNIPHIKLLIKSFYSGKN